MTRRCEFRLWLVAVATMNVAGCMASAQRQPADTEQSLAAQAESVRTGNDRIQVEHTALHDDDLRLLAGLAQLRVLLLDSPQSRITASGLRQIRALPKLEHLRIRGSGIDDDALAQIAEIKSLQILNLPKGTFSNEGLIHLKQLPDLVQFRFGSFRVTDAGMKTLGELPALKRLHLIDVPITDAGLRELAQIKQLESLYIDGGQFSDQALDQFFRERPDLHVHLNQQHHDRDPQTLEHR
jgi:hypothetical protein